MATKSTTSSASKGRKPASGSKAGAKKATAQKSAAKRTTAQRTSAKSTASKKSGSRYISNQKNPVLAVSQERTNPLVYMEIFLWIVLAVSVLLFISFLGFGGAIGKAINTFGFGCFGILAYILPFLLFFLTAFLISNRRSRLARIKALGVFLLYFTLCGIMELLLLGYEDSYPLAEYYEAGARYRTGGGLFGGMLVNLFCPAIGIVGAYLMLFIMLIICVVIITQKSIFAGVKHKSQKVYRTAREEQARRKEIIRAQRELERQQNPWSFERQIGASDDAMQAAPVNFSVLPKEPRMYNRVSGVTKNTSLSGLDEKKTDEVRQVLPRKTQQNLDMPVMDLKISRSGEPTADYNQPSNRAEEEIHVQTLENATGSKQKQKGISGLLRRGSSEADAIRRAAKAEFDSLKDLPYPSAEPDEEEDDFDSPVVRVRESFRKGGLRRSENAAHAAASDGKSISAGQLDAPGEDDGTDNEGEQNLKTSENANNDTVKESASRSPKKPRASAQEIQEGIDNVEQEIEKNSAIVKPQYIFPPISLLQQPSKKRTGESDDELRDTAQKLQQILHTFGVNVRVTDVSCGPSVTRYEMIPEMGVKVSKIVNLADDIKLNLAAADIRIEAPIPGKAAVGIEVPNKVSSGVMMRELLESEEFRNHPSNLAYVVGKDIAGKIIISDIAKMPHLLIAGATGSGKSVFINTLIMSIIYKAKPDEVKLIMIDPKVVELSVYNGIPHLFIPVVTDPKKAAGALNWGVAEMMQRYEKFASVGVRDLKGYNAKVDKLKDIEDENKPEKLPQIVIIVDELADMMMVASGEVEDAIVRLTQLARAAGIHLVIATQRPSVDVITGLIKANMPSRIAFSVSSGVDSRTILDMVGAEKLLGNGDMLFAPQTYKKPARIQGAFVSDKEVADVVAFLKDKNTTSDYNEQMEAQIAQVQKSAMSAGGGGDVDELFAEAGKFIIEKDKASIGMLQRWFKIGFNRAARIMDQLSDAEVVGPEEGTKPRKVLMSMEQFENYLEQN